MTIRLDATTSECGGSVVGTAAWDGGGAAEVSLGWSTSGDGAVDSAVVDTASLTGGEATFSLAVPAEGPMSFEGSLVAVRWEVVLRAGETTEIAEVAVLPAGGLTVWVRNVAPPPST